MTGIIVQAAAVLLILGTGIPACGSEQVAVDSSVEGDVREARDAAAEETGLDGVDLPDGADVPDAPGDEGPACSDNCDDEGSRMCSVDLGSVLECRNVLTPDRPCLQWVVHGDCADGETCEDGACVPAAVGCCTVEGTGCCELDDCCDDATITEACIVRSYVRNGSEVCDDVIRTELDPALNRYFLLCLNDRGGTAYVSTNSGDPCGDPPVARCQCWEEIGIRPWDVLDYVATLVCDAAGKRLEVTLPGPGSYHWGVHPVPGDYGLAGYCPTGEGCMTCIGLLELPR